MWKERNRRIFEGVAKSLSKVIDTMTWCRDTIGLFSNKLHTLYRNTNLKSSFLGKELGVSARLENRIIGLKIQQGVGIRR